MDDQQGNVIDGTARAGHWRRSRPKQHARGEGVEPRSDAPKSIASSLLVPADALDGALVSPTGEQRLRTNELAPGAMTAEPASSRTNGRDADAHTHQNLFLSADAAAVHPRRERASARIPLRTIVMVAALVAVSVVVIALLNYGRVGSRVPAASLAHGRTATKAKVPPTSLGLDIPGLPAAVHRLLDDGTARTTARHAQGRQRRRPRHTPTNAPMRASSAASSTYASTPAPSSQTGPTPSTPTGVSGAGGNGGGSGGADPGGQTTTSKHVSQRAGPTGPHSLVSAGICGGCH